MRDYEIMHDELLKRLDRIIRILETLSSPERSKRRPEYVDTTILVPLRMAVALWGVCCLPG